MKNLILIRHAKSSWDYNVTDEKRPLADRGISDAHLVSEEFSSNLFKPDAIFSSPANRALSTCKIFMRNLNLHDNLLTISNKLYDFSGENVMEFIKNIDKQHNNVIIFGHNFAFTSLTNLLGSEFIDNLPTCGLVWLQFDIDSWNDITKGKTKLIIKPKDLKD